VADGWLWQLQRREIRVGVEKDVVKMETDLAPMRPPLLLFVIAALTKGMRTRKDAKVHAVVDDDREDQEELWVLSAKLNVTLEGIHLDETHIVIDANVDGIVVDAVLKEWGDHVPHMMHRRGACGLEDTFDFRLIDQFEVRTQGMNMVDELQIVRVLRVDPEMVFIHHILQFENVRKLNL